MTKQSKYPTTPWDVRTVAPGCKLQTPDAGVYVQVGPNTLPGNRVLAAFFYVDGCNAEDSANLFAAALKLLDACRLAQHVLWNNPEHRGEVYRRNAMDSINSAIHAATGGTMEVPETNEKQSTPEPTGPFSAGEWSINNWPQQDASIRIGAPGTPCIAEIPAQHVSNNEQKANAALVAAAPNLYRACKEMVTGWDHPNSDSVRMRCDAITSIRAAITKAETGTAGLGNTEPALTRLARFASALLTLHDDAVFVNGHDDESKVDLAVSNLRNELALIGGAA